VPPILVQGNVSRSVWVWLLVPLPRPVGEKHHPVRSWNSNQHIEHMIFHMLRFQNSRFINHRLQKAIIFSKSEHIWTMSTTVCLYYLWLTCDDTFQWHAHIGHHLSPSDATWVASFVHPILRFPCRFASEPADRWGDLGYPTRNQKIQKKGTCRTEQQRINDYSKIIKIH